MPFVRLEGPYYRGVIKRKCMRSSSYLPCSISCPEINLSPLTSQAFKLTFAGVETNVLVKPFI